MKDDPLTDCPTCEGGHVRRKIGLGAGIIFKGSGFYETDFKDRKGSKPGDSGESGGKSGGGDSKQGDAAKSEKSSSGAGSEKAGQKSASPPTSGSA